LLLSNDREKFSDAEKKRLEEFDKTMSAMAKDGIRLEVCLFAANLLGVKPETIASEVHQVANDWIASTEDTSTAPTHIYLPLLEEDTFY
jgi:hypothetical protein